MNDNVKIPTFAETLSMACTEYENALRKESYIVSGSKPDIVKIAEAYGLNHLDIWKEHSRRMEAKG